MQVPDILQIGQYPLHELAVPFHDVLHPDIGKVVEGGLGPDDARIIMQPGLEPVRDGC